MRRAAARISIVFISLMASIPGWAQTPGVIVKAAAGGRAVLDPNGDGYVSAASSGFVANDVGESEIPYRPLAQVEFEPITDLATGPGGGFTDFVDQGTAAAASTYTSAAGNLMFRFRLGNIAPNSKGYSILIDTDGRIGSADPDAVAGNPGFEVEILLATNFGVRLFNVNGMGSGVTPLVTLPYDDYCQKAVAFTRGSGNADYFYDFYIPFSVITANIPGFTASTPVRMVANTVIAPQSVINQKPSDISGINDPGYANYTDAWTQVITGTVGQASNVTTTTPLPPIKAQAPTVYNNLMAGATSISGTSVEPNGTRILVYVNGTLRDSATVNNNLWTLGTTSPALAVGQAITARARATGKSL